MIMPENMPPEIEERFEAVQKYGLTTAALASILYTGALFTLGFFFSALALIVTGLPPDSYASTMAVIGIFVTVTLVDLYLVIHKKISPAIVMCVLVLSPFIVLYRLFTGIDLFGSIQGGLPELFRP